MELTIKLDMDSVELLIKEISRVFGTVKQINDEKEDEKLYRLVDISKILGISYNTLKVKPLPYCRKKNGKRKMYSLSEVKQYLELND